VAMWIVTTCNYTHILYIVTATHHLLYNLETYIVYVIVITWARVICLKYTHEHEGLHFTRARGPAGPECKCVYFRQIKSVHVITNISH